MKRDYIRLIVEEVINEVAEQECLSLVYEMVDNAHRLLNKAQGKLMMSGMAESETFNRINQCDKELIDILNGR